MDTPCTFFFPRKDFTFCLRVLGLIKISVFIATEEVASDLQCSSRTWMEQLTESRNSYDRNKLWTINAEVGHVCPYDQHVYTKVAKEVGIVDTDSRTAVCLLNLPWWLLAILTAIIMKVWRILTGGSMYYMHLQLWLSYAPYFQSVITPFAQCKRHPLLLGGYVLADLSKGDEPGDLTDTDPSGCNGLPT